MWFISTAIIIEIKVIAGLTLTTALICNLTATACISYSKYGNTQQTVDAIENCNKINEKIMKKFTERVGSVIYY